VNQASSSNNRYPHPLLHIYLLQEDGTQVFVSADRDSRGEGHTQSGE